MSWHKPITQNLGIKIAALLLAAALYLHVVTERLEEDVFYFPVEVAGLADTLALSEDLPERLGARLRGTGKQFIRLRVLQPSVRVDLTGVGPGTFQKALTPADFHSAVELDLEVLAPVDPSNFSVRLEPRASRVVPVSVRLRGVPARGFLLGSVTGVRPEVARLSGPASWVAEQEGIETEPLDVGGRRESVEEVLALMPPPPWAAVQPGSVLVQVPIEPEERGEAVVRPQVVGLRAEGFTTQLDPSEVRISWSAPQSASQNSLAKVRVQVDVERRGRGRYTLPVRVTGPGSEFVISVTPESVAVTLH